MLKTLENRRKNKKSLYLLATIALGIIILWPLHNFQYFLSTGDHGRDLYCFKKTMEGAIPYRDYSWLYGPLSPYYYALFFSLFGATIQSALLGQNLIILFTGVLIFLICAKIISKPTSMIAALVYWIFRDLEFFHTYTHSLGILLTLISFWALLNFFFKNKKIYLYIGFFSLFLLILTRLNLGVAGLFAFFLSLCLNVMIKKQPKPFKTILFYAGISFLTLLGALFIYYIIVKPLPLYAIKQCFPYAKAQRTDSTTTLLGSFKLLNQITTNMLSASYLNLFLGALFVLYSVIFVVRLLRNKLNNKKINLIFLGSLFIYILGMAHEFFLSGVYYRIFWFFPLAIILYFFFADIALKKLPKPVYWLFLLFFGSVVFLGWKTRYVKILSFKTPEHHLVVGNNNIYTTQRRVWIETVEQATKYIKDNIPKDEIILVMPFDSLYLFLADRDSATRQLVFFEHILITKEQEAKIISEMENPKANWVILSNRARSGEGGLGNLGETYCVTLGQYLMRNFEFKAQFGDWTNPPGWAWNHGIRIFKKK